MHYLDNPESTPDGPHEVRQGPGLPDRRHDHGPPGHQATPTRPGAARSRCARSRRSRRARNGKSKIVVTELPYQVNKARLAEKIADLVKTRKLKDIADLKDESNREGMRLVIETKRGANPQVVLNQLYKHTQLQENFGVIMLALVDGVPRTLNLAEMIGYYVDHQVDVVTRRTRYDLRKAEERDHIVSGLLIALDNLDEVIKIIRGSQDADEARTQADEEVQAQRDPGEPHPGHAAAPAHHAWRASRARARSTRTCSSASSYLNVAARGPGEAPRRHQGGARSRSARSTRTRAAPSQGRRRRPRRRGPDRRGGRRHHGQPRRLREAPADRLVQAPGARRQGRPGAEPQGRGRGQARLHHHHAPLDAVLHHQGPGLPREGARDPRVGPHRARASTPRTCRASRSTATRRSARSIDLKEYDGGALPAVRDPQRAS